MKETNKQTTFSRQSTKVQQLADMLSSAISLKGAQENYLLPSINQLSAEYKVSRDTVFKAFMNLRERKIIDSIPGKGYFVVNQPTNVLLLLDQYTPFKETLYNTFVKHLPNNYKVDLLFHQYSARFFKNIINESAGRYNKYIVMNFDNEKISPVLKKLTPDKVLLLDFGKFNKSKYSYICQDFDENFYQALLQLQSRLHRYDKFVFLFPKELMHPQSSKIFFRRFCEEQNLKCEILENLENLCVENNTAYLAIKQQDIVKVIKSGRKQGLTCGNDYGLLAYNDIPSYEVIDNGITALTINWEAMGTAAAAFVADNISIHQTLPTEVHLRHSI